MRRRRYKWVPLSPKRSGVARSARAVSGLMMVRPEEVSVVGSEISCQAELIPEDPSVGPHDEVVSLLHGAAEIEHSLLVQYLYAAYSLEMDPKHFTGEVPAKAESLVRMWRDSMVTIAVQEMAHLLTVQNLLRFIGGPLNFEREDLPFKSDLYPFHFALRPLSRATLGWYIAAEMPNDPPSEIFPDEIAKEIAATLPEGRCVNRVGALYERLIALFDKLPDRVFRPQSVAFQARARDWGADSELLVYEIGSKEQALAALVDIGRQGEGFGGLPTRRRTSAGCWKSTVIRSSRVAARSRTGVSSGRW
jgi:Ferritin-like